VVTASKTPARPATYADLEALPPHVVGEILGGELYVQPRPAALHARAASKLGITIGGAYYRGGDGGPGGWIILYEPELHFDDDVIVPDLAGWRRARMPEEPEGAFISLAPDWVCEVASPSTERVDRLLKRSIYARAGVGHLWHVMPPQQLIEVLRLEEGRWVLATTVGPEGPATIEPFDVVPVDLDFVWGK
jgi:Uma2 family endonuclease